jgi:hypothetical protein
MNPSVALLRQKVEAALSELTAAEGALESALLQLQPGVRAEKVTISAAVGSAFARVRAAREELARLQEQVDSD